MNEFDLAMYGDDELNGFIKKAFKKVKRTVSKVNRVRLKVGRAVTPKFARKAVKKVLNNKVVQSVAVVAATAVGQAWVAPAIKAGTSFTKYKQMSQEDKKYRKEANAWAGRTRVEMLKMGYSEDQIRRFIVNPSTFNEAPARSSRMAVAHPSVSGVASDPRFVNEYNRQLQQGRSPNQIAQNFQQSKAYQAVAKPEVMKQVQPIVHKTIIEQGAPRQIAKDLSYVASDEVAKKQVEQGGFNVDRALKVAAIAVPVLLAVRGG